MCIDEKSVIGLTESDWQMNGPAMAIQRRPSFCENVKPILTLVGLYLIFRSIPTGLPKHRLTNRNPSRLTSTFHPSKSTPSITQKPYYTRIKKKFIMAYGVFTLDVIVTLALSGGLLYNYGDWFRHRVLVTLAGMATKS